MNVLALPRLVARIDLMTRLRAFQAISHQRRDLAQLDACQLDDIGVSEAERQTEVARPFWDVPSHWKG